jgi:hypothetical protein
MHHHRAPHAAPPRAAPPHPQHPRQHPPLPRAPQVKGLEEQLAAASSKLAEAGAELKRMQAAAVAQIQGLNEQLAAAKAEAAAATKVRCGRAPAAAALPARRATRALRPTPAPP